MKNLKTWQKEIANICTNYSISSDYKEETQEEKIKNQFEKQIF